LEADGRDDAREHDRGDDVPGGRERTHTGNADQTPALGAAHDGQRDPVIRQDGMEVYVVTADEAGGAWQRLVLSPRMRLRATESEAKGRLCQRG